MQSFHNREPGFKKQHVCVSLSLGACVRSGLGLGLELSGAELGAGFEAGSGPGAPSAVQQCQPAQQSPL